MERFTFMSMCTVCGWEERTERREKSPTRAAHGPTRGEKISSTHQPLFPSLPTTPIKILHRHIDTVQHERLCFRACFHQTALGGTRVSEKREIDQTRCWNADTGHIVFQASSFRTQLRSMTFASTMQSHQMAMYTLKALRLLKIGWQSSTNGAKSPTSRT